MGGKNIGYIRVSSADQNTARQLDGVELDKVYEDKCSGKDRKRPALRRCLAYLKSGDTLHVHSIDRLARNLIDLQKLIETLTSRGIRILFHKEGMTFDGASETPMNTLMMQMIGAFAQFERAMIHERQREGIARAKAEGRKLGRKPKLSEADVEEVRKMKAEGSTMREICLKFGMSRQGVYKALRRAGGK